ncbi:hypothetical protein MMC09_003651 [Bachmanniomyces sp. S44760]|nr:hypothetical protein [Bachmanniomyces sp. S44760]
MPQNKSKSSKFSSSSTWSDDDTTLRQDSCRSDSSTTTITETSSDAKSNGKASRSCADQVFDFSCRNIYITQSAGGSKAKVGSASGTGRAGCLLM